MCLRPLVLLPPMPPSSQPCFLAVIMSPCCRHVFSQHSRLHNTVMSPSEGVWAWFTYGTCILVWRNKTFGPQKGILQLYIGTELIMWKSLPLIFTSDVVVNLNSDSSLDSWLRLVVGLGVTGNVTCNGWLRLSALLCKSNSGPDITELCSYWDGPSSQTYKCHSVTMSIFILYMYVHTYIGNAICTYVHVHQYYDY